MDSKTLFINNILIAMSISLNEHQIQILKNVLNKELMFVTLTSSTQIKCTQKFKEDERLFKLFIASKRLEGTSEKTISQYFYEMKKMLAYLNKGISDIKTVDIQYYLSNYEKTHNICRRTVDNMRKAINGFYIWGVESKYVSENPVSGIKPIAYENKSIETLTDEELFKVREAARTNLRTRAMVELLIATGIRVSEMIAIDINNIDFNKNEILIHSAKKRKKEDRTIFLTAEAKVCISDYLTYRNNLQTETNALFIGNKNGGKRCTERLINGTLREIERKIGLKKKLTVHMFRKTLATQLYTKGMKPLDIAYILGHADSRMSETYYIGVKKIMSNQNIINISDF